MPAGERVEDAPVGDQCDHAALSIPPPARTQHRDEVRHARVEGSPVLARVQVGAWMESRLGLGVGLGFGLGFRVGLGVGLGLGIEARQVGARRSPLRSATPLKPPALT